MPPPSFSFPRRWLAIILLSAVQALSIQGQVIYVNQHAAGLNDGTSWADAYTDLKSALQSASYGEEIWVAEGTYAPNTSVSFTEPGCFILPSGVRLLGGFSGAEQYADERDWQSQLTVLTAKGTDYSTFNVMYAEGTDTTTVLDGFVIRDGWAQGIFFMPCDTFYNSYACGGGGIHLHSSNSEVYTYLSIRNCRFEQNRGIEGGAILANFGSGSGGLDIENCVFSRDTSINGGGAISIITGQIPQLPFRIADCVFEYGYSDYASAAVRLENYNPDLDFKLTNSLFFMNTARWTAGAMYILGNGANPLIEQCVFLRNGTALEWGVSGYAGVLLGMGFQVKNCAFIENKARIGAACIGGKIEYSGCLFAKNSAVVEGGAIQVSPGCKIVNCSFIDNETPGKGGAIYSKSGPMTDTIRNCLFWGNRSGADSRSIHLATTTAKVYLEHCALNVPECSDMVMTTGTPGPGSEPVACGPGMQYGVDPLLRDTAAGDYRLRGCSPLIDGGNSIGAANAGLLTDLAGDPRWQDDHVDIGAYETPKLWTMAAVQNLLCHGDSSGIVLINAFGGFEPYTAAWSTGDVGMMADGLPAGAHSVTVTDADACADTVTVTLTQPDALQFSLNHMDYTGAAQPNGAAWISGLLGGTPPYAVFWSNGMNSDTISGLLPGIYAATISDANACEQSDKVEVLWIVGTDEKPLDGFCSIYPNPTRSLLTIEIAGNYEYPAPFSIKVANMTGQPMAGVETFAGQVHIESAQWPPGVYTVEISSKDGKIWSPKMIIKH
jgi:predicted outer membrane repeat protein